MEKKKSLKEILQENPDKTGVELLKIYHDLEKEFLLKQEEETNKHKLLANELSKSVPLYYKVTKDPDTNQESYEYYKVNTITSTGKEIFNILCSNVELITLFNEEKYFSFDYEKDLTFYYNFFHKGLNNKGNDKIEKVSGVDFENLFKKYSTLKHNITEPFWKNVDEKRLPCYETGNWDGKKSDLLLLKDCYGAVYTGFVYECMCEYTLEFYNVNGYEIDEKIIQWAEIPD